VIVNNNNWKHTNREWFTVNTVRIENYALNTSQSLVSMTCSKTFSMDANVTLNAHINIANTHTLAF